ncbi:MAG: aspartate kinase [Clostridia bacterium]|nr:aspartate kinase [Clostridia bacterium]
MTALSIIVQKFGGTSVANPDACARVVSRILEARSGGHDVVAVVSAMGRKPAPYSTDSLIELAERGGANMSPREQDAIIACGEIISSVVLVSALAAAGCPAVSLTGGQAGIITDDAFGDARIRKIDPKRILEALAQGKVAVVAGFQGATESGDITTLGRGGSDTTAAALGAVLEADVIEIFTDVEGIMTADPRIVPEARYQETMAYADLLEMANLGAKVVHQRAVEIAMQSRIPLLIRSTFSDARGTLVTDGASKPGLPVSVPDRFISGVTCLGGMAQVTLAEADFNSTGRVLDVFTTLADECISVDMISVFPERIAFIVAAKQADHAIGALRGIGLAAQANLGCAKVSVVGAGMRGVPGVMSKVVRALHNTGVRILQTSDSHHSISCLVPEADMERAARALHAEFELSR